MTDILYRDFAMLPYLIALSDTLALLGNKKDQKLREYECGEVLWSSVSLCRNGKSQPPVHNQKSSPQVVKKISVRKVIIFIHMCETFDCNVLWHFVKKMGPLTFSDCMWIRGKNPWCGLTGGGWLWEGRKQHDLSPVDSGLTRRIWGLVINSLWTW